MYCQRSKRNQKIQLFILKESKKMRFGGHQTFTIREGWLHKGMQLLMKKSERWKLVDDYAFDYLGVGRNMAKSINHWLLATGLATKKTEKGKRGRMVETKDLIPTDFAKLIWKKDPYFLDEGTWWMIHINLINTEEHAKTWYWFFNHFGLERFQKQVCLQSLMRREVLNSGRTPSQTTLDRDLSCFLNTYAKDIPSKKKDPEDEIESPLVELGLMNYYRTSGYYQVTKDNKNLNPYIFLYAASTCSTRNNNSSNTAYTEVPFFELTRMDNGPGRAFLLSNEGLFELLMSYENSAAGPEVRLLGLAGDRLVRFLNKKPLEWMTDYYEAGVN